MRAVRKMLDTVLAWFTILLFAVLVCVVVWQVASREIVGDPSTWSQEAAQQLFVWTGLIATAYVFGQRGHIAVEYAVRKLPEAAERWVAVLVQLLILAFAIVALIWGGYRAAQGAWSLNLTALPFTVGHMYLALPVSGVLISLYCIYFIVEIGRAKQPPYPEIGLPSEAAGYADADGTVQHEGGPDHIDGLTPGGDGTSPGEGADPRRDRTTRRRRGGSTAHNDSREG